MSKSVNQIVGLNVAFVIGYVITYGYRRGQNNNDGM